MQQQRCCEPFTGYWASLAAFPSRLVSKQVPGVFTIRWYRLYTVCTVPIKPEVKEINIFSVSWFTLLECSPHPTPLRSCHPPESFQGFLKNFQIFFIYRFSWNLCEVCVTHNFSCNRAEHRRLFYFLLFTFLGVSTKGLLNLIVFTTEQKFTTVLFICSLNSGGKIIQWSHRWHNVWLVVVSIPIVAHVSPQGPRCLRRRLNDTPKLPSSNCMAVFSWVFIYCYFFPNICILKNEKD